MNVPDSILYCAILTLLSAAACGGCQLSTAVPGEAGELGTKESKEEVGREASSN